MIKVRCIKTSNGCELEHVKCSKSTHRPALNLTEKNKSNSSEVACSAKRNQFDESKINAKGYSMIEQSSSSTIRSSSETAKKKSNSLASKAESSSSNNVVRKDCKKVIKFGVAGTKKSLQAQ